MAVGTYRLRCGLHPRVPSEDSWTVTAAMAAAGCLRCSRPSWPRASVSARIRVVLAVGVLGQLLECPVGQPARIGANCAGNGAQIVGLEGAVDCFAVVPAAVQDRVRQHPPRRCGRRWPCGGLRAHPRDSGAFAIRGPRLIVANCCHTSLASSAVLSVPASSSRSNRRATVLPLLISISSSARRFAPSASRFLAFGAFFDTILQPGDGAVWMRMTLIRRSKSRNSCDRGRRARRHPGQGKARRGVQPQSEGRPGNWDKR